jgi:hypothetical protein
MRDLRNPTDAVEIRLKEKRLAIETTGAIDNVASETGPRCDELRKVL